ncbi:monovalent cation:proton antiporter-2 (CPA2) family protein [Methylophaga thiooxydans]|uniref:Putative transporter, CPA2 family n=1 Tax=Methylophaga thiooxydans DMS010 TaxID=637616 RepID=C0N2Y2_9GAMM|nr:monovalent cation:proton antiporter-2 (CPA2) family protein [Methylophaga thiooxydans]EEF80819.1 putative transporter, CPA2 family [Methylophaga thiooxydans DMS010]
MQEAGGHYLVDILALLLATVVIIPFFHRIRLGAILGYLTAGVIVGPWGFGVITEVEDIRHLAEFGVIFLLFVLGIELKPDKLWQMRKMVIGLGLGQVLITAGLIYGVAIWFGVSNKSAVIIGFGLALSSTAFCLKLLAERGGISTVMGRMSFSVLLLQDIAVVPLLALVSYFAGGSPDIMEPSLKPVYAILVIIALLFAGRYLLNPVLGRIVASHDPEVFIALSVLLVLGVAWIMETVGFSMALGAFLAGVMMAESHYRHQIEADILPFRGILLGLFFMTVGMGIDFSLLWERLLDIVLLTLGLMVLKTLVVYLLSRVSGARHDISLQAGVLLSQSGEFGFVLFGFAAASGVLEEKLGDILTLVIALTMVLTPFVVKGTNMLLIRFYTPKETEDDDYAEFVESSDEHVILAGFGRVGARVGTLLGAAGVPYIALDMKQKRVKDARSQGFPVFFGDASKVKVLQAAGADHAKMIVVTLDDPGQIDRLVSQVRQFYPSMPIHARARDRKHCADLITQGATTTVSETLETSLRLTEEVLLGSGVEETVATRVIDEFRDDYYSNVVQKVTENKVVLGELKH